MATPTIALHSNDLCWCGSGRKYKRCHKPLEGRILPHDVSPMRSVPAGIGRPPYAETGIPPRWNEPLVKTPELIERMRRAGALAAEVLRRVGEQVAPGVTTDELDVFGHELTVEHGAYPSPLNYNCFPKSVCTSVNEVICHGIPDDRALQDGDIVNVDVTVFLDGVHGDTNATFFVGRRRRGEPPPRTDHPSSACGAASRRCVPGRPINEIGRAIEDHARRHRLRRRARVHRPRHRRAVPRRPADPPLLRAQGPHHHASPA